MREPNLTYIGCHFIKASALEKQLTDKKITFRSVDATDTFPAHYIISNPFNEKEFIECSCLFGYDFLDDTPFGYEDAYVFWSNKLHAAITLWDQLRK